MLGFSLLYDKTVFWMLSFLSVALFFYYTIIVHDISHASIAASVEDGPRSASGDRDLVVRESRLKTILPPWLYLLISRLLHSALTVNGQTFAVFFLMVLGLEWACCVASYLVALFLFNICICTPILGSFRKIK